MNEEFFNTLYLETGMKEAGISESQYSELLLNNEELRISTYGELGFDKEGVSIEDFDSLLGLKKKEPTVSTSSDGESPSKEVEPTAERSELSEEDRLKAQETSDLFNTFTPMEDPNDSPMPSEENFSLGEEDQQKLETQEAVSFPTETEEEYVVSTVDNIFKGDDKIDDYLLEKENPGPVNDAVISKYYKTLSEYYGSDRLEEIKKKKEEEGLPSDIAKDVALDEISDEAYALSMITRDLSE